MTPNKGTYTLTAYGECGADTTTFDVDINALVELPADTNICSGDTLMVMASLNNGTYTWSNGSTGQNVGIHMPGEYYVNVVDSDGCWSTDTMEVTVSAAVWLRSDTTVCSGATVELDPGTAGGTYTWFRNGTSFSTATKVFADSAGEYSVSYTDAKNCTSTDTFMLTIAAQPNARFTVSQLSNSSNLRFEAVDTTGSNYYWSFGDGKSVSGPSWFTLNQYLANGSYSVTLVMTSQLCGDSTYSKEVDVIGIGLSEQLAEQGLKIYPNPTADYVTVDLSQIELDLRLELVSMSGQKMFSSSLNSLSTNKIEFNKNLSSGLYVINIMDSENNLVYTQTLSIK
jgi:hypothetical protein